MSEELKCPACGRGINEHGKQGVWAIFFDPYLYKQECKFTPQAIAVHYIRQARKATIVEVLKIAMGFHATTRRESGRIATEIIMAKILRMPGAPSLQELESIKIEEP